MIFKRLSFVFLKKYSLRSYNRGLQVSVPLAEQLYLKFLLTTTTQSLVFGKHKGSGSGYSEKLAHMSNREVIGDRLHCSKIY